MGAVGRTENICTIARMQPCMVSIASSVVTTECLLDIAEVLNFRGLSHQGILSYVWVGLTMLELLNIMPK